MKQKYITLVLIVFFIKSINAQFINDGELGVQSNTTISVYENATISNNGVLVNDGDLYLFDDLTNNGSISFNASQNTSVLNFVGNQQQIIQGVGVTNLLNVEFNNNSGDFAFDLQKELNVSGVLFFQEGIIHENNQGLITFSRDAIYTDLSNQSYVNNSVRRQGNTSFLYPVGDYQDDVFIPRKVVVRSLGSINDQFRVTFNWENSNVNFSHSDKEASIGLIDMNEFWEINREVGNSEAVVTLTWSDVTSPNFINSNPEEIIVVRWNGEQWVDEGGEIDILNKEITTTVSEFGVFTLANKSGNNVVADLDVSDSFSPDGDGINDVFMIPGLEEKYPNFKMKIYNRYGNIVYDYKNNGNLNPLWWDGKSKNKISISRKSEIAPAATYWYIIYFNDGVTKPYQAWLYLNK